MKAGIWALIALAGGGSLAVVALARGEPVNALWIVVASLSVYAIAYRFYARFIAERVLALSAARRTPALRLEDGLDYVPTQRWVLFGHHFAAISGAGPLIGPVLAAQMGYLPGTLWLITGVVFAGAVQDMVILALSTRRDGRSLGQMIRTELGPAAGLVALVGILAIMIILLAVLGLIVVKALAGSPWGTFTVMATVPIAVLMGIYGRYLRPGQVGEMSALGALLLVLALVGGAHVAADPAWAAWFSFTGPELAIGLGLYGFLASILPVWLVLAPRDYLSTFLKIGTIALLAVGILVIRPTLHMPAVTRFIDGSGPVFAGPLFPFLFITIACGAVSGFHALISSGTTPKMIEDERDARLIGYGAMLVESFVGIMALVAATALDPAVYFALNAPAALIGTTPDAAAGVITGWGFPIEGPVLTETARSLGEATILSRAGGAPTLAAGMAQILASLVGGPALTAFWYHFAILFEALFILTTLDAGTRCARFMLQDLLGLAHPALGRTGAWPAGLLATALVVLAWGWFLYQGVADPLGGINSLWPLFGIANQMLAAIALTFATVVLFKMKAQRFAWLTALPTAWLLICTLSAGLHKLFSADPRIGFLSHLARLRAADAAGTLLAPAKTASQMAQIELNDLLDATLCALFMAVVVAILVIGAKRAADALQRREPSCVEATGAVS